MFRLEAPVWGWSFLLLVVVMAALLWAGWRYRIRMRTFISEANQVYMIPPGRKKVDQLKNIFLLLALFFFCLSLLNPQTAGKEETVEHKGSDIIFALDISQSMLVSDIAPNRLAQAKRLALSLLQALPSERIGLVFFAGSGFVQMPLSADHQAAAIFINNAHPDMVTNQGTAIGDAIELSSSLFSEEDDRSKAIVIISDGEDHDNRTSDLAKTAGKKGILICTVGLGTESGGEVPFSQEGVQMYSEENQEQVISKFDPESLRSIAKAGRGAFHHLQDDERTVVKSIRSLIDQLEKKTIEWKRFADYNSFFQYPLLLGILAYVLFVIWPYRIAKK